MAASITVHLQIFKRTQLLHFSTDFDETGIKIHGLQSSFLCNTLIIRVAVPFKFCPFILKIWSKNQILASIKGRSSVANLRKTKIYNTNINLVNDDVHTKFGLILSIRSQDME